MKWAIIKNNVVENVAVADEEFAVQQGWIPCVDYAGPGWGYIDGVFTPPLPIELPPPPAPTKEELLQQLLALQAQIQSLE